MECSATQKDADDDDEEGEEGEGEGEDDDSEAAVRAFIESLPEWSQARLIALQQIHDERDEIMKQYREELRQLEIKYDALQRPNFEKVCSF